MNAPIFDLGQPAGFTSDWPTSKTPWLARDVNGNGRIDDGAELSGSSTRLENGRTAKDGFEALADLDTNHDGVLDADDATWDELLVWRDRDENRRSAPAELTSVRAAGLLRIQVTASVPRAAANGAPPCDKDGNCEIEQGSFTYVAADGQTTRGMAIDIDLAVYPVVGQSSVPGESCE